MRQRLSIAALIPFALAASLAANVSTEPQAPEAGRPGTASQDQAKPSAKASLSASARKIPCKTPENASLCYWTHGRLAVYNGGAPNFRLWKIGTRRIVGVFSGPSRFPPKVEEADESPELPAELLKAYEADNRRILKFARSSLRRKAKCRPSVSNRPRISSSRRTISQGPGQTSSFLSYLLLVLIRQIRVYPGSV